VRDHTMSGPRSSQLLIKGYRILKADPANRVMLDMLATPVHSISKTPATRRPLEAHSGDRLSR
jgi:hypothetical protein